MPKTLKEWRDSRGLTLKELALEIDYGFQTINGYENGKPVSDAFLKKFCEYFQISQSDILLKDRNSQPPPAPQTRPTQHESTVVCEKKPSQDPVLPTVDMSEHLLVLRCELRIVKEQFLAERERRQRSESTLDAAMAIIKNFSDKLGQPLNLVATDPSPPSPKSPSSPLPSLRHLPPSDPSCSSRD